MIKRCVAIAVLVLLSAACGPRKPVAVQPGTPTGTLFGQTEITPEMRAQRAKALVGAGIITLQLRIGHLERDPALAVRLGVARAAVGVLERLQRTLEPITRLDLANAEQVRRIMQTAVTEATNLLNDPQLVNIDAAQREELKTLINLAVSAAQTIALLIPR